MTETLEVTETTQRRNTPWSRINRLDSDTHYESVSEVLEGSELDFTVSKRAIRFERQDGTWETAADRMYVVRDDDETPIDVVSKDYGVFQYGEAFDFVNHIKDRQFVAAGPLKDARQAFIVVRLPDLDELNVLGSDAHELNVIIRTSHDRSRAVEVFTMPVRIRCFNQLPLRPMTNGITNRWAVNHIGNISDKMHDADVLVENVRAYAEDFKNTAQRLNSINLSQEDAWFVLDRVVRQSPTRDTVMDEILGLWKNADTVGFSDNGWGLVNAVSDYFEHGRRGGTAQSRLLGALEGQTRNILDRTVPLILGRFGR